MTGVQTCALPIYLINSSAKECDYSDNTKDGKVIDEGNAENCNYGSDDSGDIDNNNAGDSNSSNSNKGNKAYGCVGQRGSLAPIYSGLKLKRAIK